MKPRPRYLLVIEPQASDDAEEARMLRTCLKRLLRSLNIRCVSIEPAEQPTPQTAPTVRE